MFLERNIITSCRLLSEAYFLSKDTVYLLESQGASAEITDFLFLSYNIFQMKEDTVVSLNRWDFFDEQTIGNLMVEGEILCYTLELPWLENRRSISCIPIGDYEVKRRTSEKYGEHFHILDVPDRSHILIHHGNFNSQIKGCVLVGEELRDINIDGLPDVSNSRATMEVLLDRLPETFTLRIREFKERV